MSKDGTLIKFLCSSGIGARRYCARLVFSGAVRVNGKVSTELLLHVDPDIDQIEVSGQKLINPPGNIYLKANKPVGYVTTVSDEFQRPIILDLLPTQFIGRRLYPVGRLDMKSSGLILITNDGDLTNRLTHPKFMIEKEYEIIVTSILNSNQLSAIRQGINVNGRLIEHVKIHAIGPPSECKYRIVIKEGRKHIVRIMMMAVGMNVVSLKRVRIHTLTLDDLKEGCIEEISDRDISDLKNVIKEG